MAQVPACKAFVNCAVVVGFVFSIAQFSASARLRPPQDVGVPLVA